MEVPIWVPLASALIGAAAAGAFQTVLETCRRRHEKRSVFVAISSEIDALCRAIRELRYQDFVEQSLRESVSNDHSFEEVHVHLGSDYFSVFHGLTGRLGLLDATDARAIVRFYSLCKLAADCADPNGISFAGHQKDLAIANLKVLQSTLNEVLLTGEDIVQRVNIN